MDMCIIYPYVYIYIYIYIYCSFPEIMSQRISAGIISVGRLSVHPVSVTIFLFLLLLWFVLSLLWCLSLSFVFVCLFLLLLLHPVSVTRFPSFRTQTLENLSRYLWNKWVPEQPRPWRKSCDGESCDGDRV